MPVTVGRGVTRFLFLQIPLRQTLPRPVDLNSRVWLCSYLAIIGFWALMFENITSIKLDDWAGVLWVEGNGTNTAYKRDKSALELRSDGFTVGAWAKGSGDVARFLHGDIVPVGACLYGFMGTTFAEIPAGQVDLLEGSETQLSLELRGDEIRVSGTIQASVFERLLQPAFIGIGSWTLLLSTTLRAFQTPEDRERIVLDSHVATLVLPYQMPVPVVLEIVRAEKRSERLF